MNWYKHNKIDTLVIEYWTQSVEKFAYNKEDFTEDPFTKGLWNITKGPIRAILGTLWNIVITPMRLFSFFPDKGIWDHASVALKQTFKGIGETIYGLAQMGASGVQLLRNYASKASDDLKTMLTNLWRSEDKDFYDKKRDNVNEKVDSGYGVPNWYNKSDFPDWYKEENKDFFNVVDDISQKVENNILNFADKLEQNHAA